MDDDDGDDNDGFDEDNDDDENNGRHYGYKEDSLASSDGNKIKFFCESLIHCTARDTDAIATNLINEYFDHRLMKFNAKDSCSPPLVIRRYDPSNAR